MLTQLAKDHNMNFKLTEDDALDLQGPLFVELLAMRKAVKNSYGNVDLLERLEILYQRLTDFRIKQARLIETKP